MSRDEAVSVNKMSHEERYTPVNPLPEEIRSLSTEETVCKFCGVSYLIHNEMKRLEEELRRVREQLEGYLEMKGRVDGLEAETVRLGCEAGRLQEERAGFEARLREREGEVRGLTEECEKLKRQVEEVSGQAQQRGDRVAVLEKLAWLYPALNKQVGYLKDERATLLQEMGTLKRAFSENLTDLSSHVRSISVKFQESESHLRTSVTENLSLKAEIAAVTKDRASLSEQLSQHKDKMSVLEASSSTLNHAQQQNVQLSKMVSETQRETEECKRDMAVTREENGNLKRTVAGKLHENTELKQRLNELTKRHAGQIEDLNNKYQSSLEIQISLKNKINTQVESMSKDKQIISSKRADLETENAGLRLELVNVTKDLELIENRTRSLSEAHRKQLSDLHVSYQEQLNAALSKTETYKNQLDQMGSLKSQHQSELREASKKAQSEHEAHVREIENALKESQRGLERQIDQLSQQYSRDLKTKEQAIREIDRSYVLQLDTLRSDNTSLSNSVAQLNTQIAGYERTIKQIECRPPPARDESEQLKSLKSKNSELEGEVLSLQRIVQKECEERMELTEILDKIKSESSGGRGRDNSAGESRTSFGSGQSEGLLMTRKKSSSKSLIQNARHPHKKMPPIKNYSNWIQK